MSVHFKHILIKPVCERILWTQPLSVRNTPMTSPTETTLWFVLKLWVSQPYYLGKHLIFHQTCKYVCISDCIFRASTLPWGISKVRITIVLCPPHQDSNCSLWEESLCSHACVNTLTEQWDLFSRSSIFILQTDTIVGRVAITLSLDASSASTFGWFHS